ncbi:MAG: DNA polymerase I [Myxococcota bacterium]
MPSKAPTAGSQIVVVDGTNTLYRAFFAIPALRAADGTPTNAVYGFLGSLEKALREEQPEHLVVVFDARGKTFRHRLYPEYKAGRDAQPEDLSLQIPLLHELLDAYAVSVLEIPDFEADDVIATLVARAPEAARISIVSTDKDLMQLVDERVTLFDGIKDRRFGPGEVEERFGVPPAQLLDLRALVGDPSDNIPGVKGIGQKGAQALISKWGDLDNLLAHAEEVEPKRARNALAAGVDSARLSRELATLRADVPLDGDWPDWRRVEPDVEALRPLYQRLGFTRQLEALGGEGAPGEEDASAAVEVERIEGIPALSELAEQMQQSEGFSLVEIREAETAVALAVGLAPDRAAFVPLVGLRAGLPLAQVVEELAPALTIGAAPGWWSADAKGLQRLFAEHGVVLCEPAFDVGLAASLLDPARSPDVAALALAHAGRKHRNWEALAGRGAKAIPASELPADELEAWAAAEACALVALVKPLGAQLAEAGLLELFEQVELPLARVLAGMEREGLRVDETLLGHISTEYASALATLEREIHGLAGEEFLISSPKQLQHILFEKLALPVIKRTKTGYSTDESVLEQLALQHELPARVLSFRHLSKLKSTYVDALPRLVDAATGRIHPTWNQLGAATGRLSAANPNVQNIPIRSEEGVRIREAFVPAEGFRLVSADYSQIELRILAHFTQDESLVDAFQRGEDIHRRTAAEVWEVSPEEVTGEQRSRAKAVNFGILYGLSAFGLARQLGIAADEARETIDTYFQRYAAVKGFITKTVEDAKQAGCVRTLLGRRRPLPDLNSRNRVLRQAAERMAVNTVIQGTAADLIKKAMLLVDARLAETQPRARLLMQVHDELVVEAPKARAKAVGELLRECMEGVLSLGVPLQADVGIGDDWRQAH